MSKRPKEDSPVGVGKRRRQEAPDAQWPPSQDLSEKLAVFVQGGGGIYRKLPKQHEGFPAFKRQGAGEDRYLYKLKGGYTCGRVWMIGDELGEANCYWKGQDVDHPFKCEGGCIKSAKDVAPDVTDCPKVILVESKYSNMKGGYVRQPDLHALFPIFYSKDSDNYIWHELGGHTWYCSNQVGSCGSYWKIQSDAPHPLKFSAAELATVEAVTQFEAMTWDPEKSSEYDGNTMFVDKEFPADQSSIGADKEGVYWIRALDMNRDDDDKLWDTIDAGDLIQGSLGNCWLISAMASVAEKPERIKAVFKNHTINRIGKYQFNMWDARKGQVGAWITITIDDQIPCKNRTQFQKMAEPFYGHISHTGELWPVLLEKAFAKFVGSYMGLDSGMSAFALQAMTGSNDIYLLSREGNGWAVHKLMTTSQREKMADGDRRATPMGKLENENWDQHALFSKMLHWFKTGAILTCSIDGDSDEHKRADGLVTHHSYSFLAAFEVLSGSQALCLLRIRNPHGEVAWKGAWGRHSSEWAANPAVERYVETTFLEGRKRNEQDDDGTFYMGLEDFSNIFSLVTACETHKDFKKPDVSNAPSKIVVSSKFSNVGGVFLKGPEVHEFYPTYRCEEQGLVIYHELWNDTWYCGKNITGAGSYRWRISSHASSPDQIEREKMIACDSLSEIVPLKAPDLSKVPGKILVRSKYSNISGVFVRQPGMHQYFPTFYCAEQNLAIWHNIGDKTWKCGAQVGGSSTYWMVESQVSSPDQLESDKVSACDSLIDIVAG